MNRIKEFRENFGLSQSELAKKINTSQINISRWENVKNDINETNLILLADFFQVSIDELVGRTDYAGMTVIKNELAPTENELLNYYRQMTESQKRVLLIHAEAAVKENQTIKKAEYK